MYGRSFGMKTFCRICIFADCSPACQHSSFNASCRSPSGYTGDYCQESVLTHMQPGNPFKELTILESYSDLHQFAACSPACRNGGICHIGDIYFYYYIFCDCPRGYIGSYCQRRGIHCCTHKHAAWKKQLLHGTCTYVRTYIVQPVRTEERLESPLLRLHTLSVVFATQGHSARTEVCMHAPSTTSHYAVVAHELHIRTYLHCSLLCSVDCSPKCKNGGTCVFWYSPYCRCPSGYIGSYCQYEGICAHTTGNIYLSSLGPLIICTYTVSHIFCRL